MKREDIENKIKDKVCDGCGGSLTIRTLTENSCFTDHKEIKRLEPVCDHCSKMCWGVNRKDFELARSLVQDFGYIPYQHMKEQMYEKKDDPDWMEYYWDSQTSGAHSLIYWLREKGLLKE